MERLTGPCVGSPCRRIITPSACRILGRSNSEHPAANPFRPVLASASAVIASPTTSDSHDAANIPAVAETHEITNSTPALQMRAKRKADEDPADELPEKHMKTDPSQSPSTLQGQ